AFCSRQFKDGGISAGPLAPIDPDLHQRSTQNTHVSAPFVRARRHAMASRESVHDQILGTLLRLNQAAPRQASLPRTQRTKESMASAVLGMQSTVALS